MTRETKRNNVGPRSFLLHPVAVLEATGMTCFASVVCTTPPYRLVHCPVCCRPQIPSFASRIIIVAVLCSM